MTPGHRRKISSDQAGAALVEFAFAAPLLAVLLIGMVDLSMYISAKLAVERAARAGAEYATINGYDSAGVSAAVTNATKSRASYMSVIAANPAPQTLCACPDPAAGLSVKVCGTRCSSGLAAGTYVKASASATFTPLFPWPGMAGAQQLSANSIVRID